MPCYGKWAEVEMGPPIGKVPPGMPPPVDSPLGVVGEKPVGPLGVMIGPLGVMDGPLGVVDGPLGVVEGPLGVVMGPLGVVKGVKTVDGPDGVGGAPPEGVGGLYGPLPLGAGGGVAPEGGGDGGPPVALPQHPGHMPSARP